MRFYVVSALLLATVCAQECGVNDYDKVDCGFVGVTEDECTSKGCCWAEASDSSIPWCFQKSGAKTESCFILNTKLEEPFSASEVSTMRGFFLNNINIDGKGGVVAAPDQNTPGGSYYYHWMRDGALTMRSVLETASNFTDYEDSFKQYVTFVIKTMTEKDPNGQDVRTEPKFTLPDGAVFTDPWCRPQNDGPGLQGISLILFANELLERGQDDYVKQYLWTGDAADESKGGAIRINLDYISEGYSSNTCDLWEEIRSTNFFWNRVTMKLAMTMGVRFANKMGDTAASKSYSDMAEKINSSLKDDHWSGSFILEDVSRTKDGAVIVGLNSGYDVEADKGTWLSPTSFEVASTIASYNALFCSEYSINSADSANKIPGILYGRYGGDSYAGGNPWVLTTAALAQLLYRAASYTIENGRPSPDALAKWAEALNVPQGSSLPTKTRELAEFFAAAADGVLLRVRAHVKADEFHLDEQIDRNTGKQLSAKDLTWSYAEVLNAMEKRAEYMSKTFLG